MCAPTPISNSGLLLPLLQGICQLPQKRGKRGDALRVKATTAFTSTLFFFFRHIITSFLFLQKSHPASKQSAIPRSAATRCFRSNSKNTFRPSFREFTTPASRKIPRCRDTTERSTEQHSATSPIVRASPLAANSESNRTRLGSPKARNKPQSQVSSNLYCIIAQLCKFKRKSRALWTFIQPDHSLQIAPV